jgi:DNA-directed RNA polymerase
MTDKPCLTMEEAQAHPMWDTQLRLEVGMLESGAERVQLRKQQAEEKGQMTGLRPVRGLVEDWLPKMAEGITQWTQAYSRSKGGPKPLALQYIRQCDPYVIGLITLRAVLDHITVERTAVTALAIAIGRTVEHEQQVRQWANTRAPKAKEGEERENSLGALFRALQVIHDKNNATDTHRARSNINRFNALLKEGKFGEQGWVSWGLEVHMRIGVMLLDTLVRQTGWFQFVDDPNHVQRRGSKRGPKKILVALPGLQEWISAQLTQEGIHSPFFKPTVVPPRRWEGTRQGGYWTPNVNTPPLIRFKAHQHEQTQYAADEYDALEMPAEYDAIHYLQEVGWRVNKTVMQYMRNVRLGDTGLAKVPVHGPIPPPARLGFPDPENPKKWVYPSEEVEREWMAEAAEVYSRNMRKVSKLHSFDRILEMAEEYAEFPRFYYPHHMDFRSRKYPIPVGLQPQDDDFARALLEFADGKPIETEDHAKWLFYQVANFMGKDKMSFEERYAWAKENTDNILLMARWPFTYDDWARSDKPWQALAAIVDLAGYLEQGFGYISHAVQWVDGTCNGIQHLSAMTRDKVAGTHVNLTPGEKPQDIYKYVAKLLTDDVRRIMEAGGLPGDHAQFWLEVCEFVDMPRSLTKRPVMVMPYGGTKEAYFKYITEWLDEHRPRGSKEDKRLRNQRIYFLATRMWDVVGESVKGARKVMEWIKTCAKAASVGNQPILWKTKTGFMVRHFYGKTLSKEVPVLLDGSRVKLRLGIQTDQLDDRGQLQGIAPNFVHSQDAATLTLTVNKAEAYGIGSFASVHDAFGTHASDMDQLGVLLREAFVEVHEEDVLRNFQQACVSTTAAGLIITEGLDPQEAQEQALERIKPWTDFGELEIKDVLQSRYFFS